MIKLLLKYFFIYFCIWICSLQTFSQDISNNSRVVIDTSMYTSLNVKCLGDMPAISLNDSLLFYLKETNPQQTFIDFFCFNFNNQKESTIYAYFDKSCEYLNDRSAYPISDFWFYDTCLFVTSSNTIFCFNRQSDTTYLYSKKIVFSEFRSFFKTENFGDSIKLFWGASPKGTISLVLYDFVRDKKISSCEQIFRITPLLYFTPRDMIATNGKYVFYTNCNEYKIYIYDIQFNKIDSIYYNKNNWTPLTEQRSNEIMQKCKQPIDIIYNFDKEINAYSSIRRILSFNDYLVVFYSQTENDKWMHLYDLWQIDKEGKWKIIDQSINDYTKGDKANKLYCFRNFVNNKDEIFAVEPDVPIFRKDYQTEEQYMKAYDNHQLKYDCVLKIEKLHFE